LDPADPKLELGRVEKKQEKKKPGVTRQDPVKNSVATRCLFFTKNDVVLFLFF
jgi:hypothetical protein